MGLPRFGRKWKLQVVDGNNVALDVSDLHIQFTIEKSYMAINYGDITVYNLSSNTRTDIIKSGMRVILQAGYEFGEYGTIFDGDLFQPIWDRENVVDNSLTLHCFDGNSLLINNYIGATVEASHNMRNDLLHIMSNSRTPFTNLQNDLHEEIDNTNMPRGKVFFGQPKTYFDAISDANNGQWCYVDKKLLFVNFTNIPQSKALVLSPGTGLLGTPQQTENGVEFRSNLNPSIVVSKPPLQVKIDNALIRQKKIQQGQLQTRLDQDGFYYVAKLIHSGDTRSDEWYTDCVGFNSSVGNLSTMFQTSQQNLNG